jgi:hypothetical protein
VLFSIGSGGCSCWVWVDGVIKEGRKCVVWVVRCGGGDGRLNVAVSRTGKVVMRGRQVVGAATCHLRYCHVLPCTAGAVLEAHNPAAQFFFKRQGSHEPRYPKARQAQQLPLPLSCAAAAGATMSPLWCDAATAAVVCAAAAGATMSPLWCDAATAAVVCCCCGCHYVTAVV